MKKVLVAYDSRKGHTKSMAELIAEGIRIAGHEADTMSITEIKGADGLAGYDGLVLGCPTYHRDITQGMKTFLFLVEQADIAGKVGGAFGSYTHSGNAPSIIFDTMEHVFKMAMVSLGPFNLKEHLIGTSDGLRACQEYGKGVAGTLQS